MNEIKIPSITIDTQLPFTLDLRAEGQPLHGLRSAKHPWSRLTEVMVWENHARWSAFEGQVISYTVRTVGLTPQTKREKKFHVTEREAMVKYVNEWIAKIVERGLKEKAAQKSEKEMRANNQRAWMAKQIEEAGGVDARRKAILREGDNIAAKETFQFESNEVYGAIITALITRSPIALDIDTRDKILAKYEQHVKESWSAKNYVDSRMQELDAYLAEIKTEDAA